MSTFTVSSLHHEKCCAGPLVNTLAANVGLEYASMYDGGAAAAEQNRWSLHVCVGVKLSHEMMHDAGRQKVPPSFFHPG